MRNVLLVKIILGVLLSLNLSACISSSVDISDAKNLQVQKAVRDNVPTVIYDNYRVSSAGYEVMQLPIASVQQETAHEWQIVPDTSSQIFSVPKVDKTPDVVRLSDGNAKMAKREQRMPQKANTKTQAKAPEKTKKPVNKTTTAQELKKPKSKTKQMPTPKAEQPDKISRSHRYKVRGSHYQVFSDAKRFQEIGIASWYGPNFHGKKTANGEKYNMYAMTAAHKTLPLGSKVQVTNLENGKKVVVRINDRGPFHGGRVIDLSKTAASRLGMLKKGSARVHVKAIH